MKNITVEQIKAARALLRWDQIRLASAAGLGVATVRRIETSVGATEAGNKSVQKIRTALEAAGVEFLGDSEDRPGVRLGGKPRISD